MKTKEEIRATTKPIPRPANYKYGEKLKEWDASLPPGAEDLIARCDPFNDRIIVKLLDKPQGKVIFDEKEPLIGGTRKALVLKVGSGKLVGGRLWRRPMFVKPGDVVYIGNWVDLEGNGLALCQEADVRVYVRTDSSDT